MSELKAARDAIARGDLGGLRAMIAADRALAADWRLIMEAALFRDAAMLDALLSAGADPNALSKSEARYRPLHRAIEPKASVKRRGDLAAVVELLVAGGADPDASGCWYEGRAVETAARAADLDTAEQLLRGRGERDMVTAALLGDAAALGRHLSEDRGAAVRVDAGGGEPLHRLCASRLNRERTVDLASALIAAGASANARTRMRHAQLPVLHFACFGGGADLGLLRLLVGAGADPGDGLYEALWSGDLAGAGMLVELGASPDGWSHVSDRPMLSEMIQWGRNAAALWLLQQGADPNQPDSAGRTALHFAYSRGAPASVHEALLAAGAELWRRDAAGATPEQARREG